MLYNFRHALAVNVESVLGQWRSAKSLACNLLWPCSLIETSDRLIKVGFTDREKFTQRVTRRQKIEIVSESISVECLCSLTSLHVRKASNAI